MRTMDQQTTRLRHRGVGEIMIRPQFGEDPGSLLAIKLLPTTLINPPELGILRERESSE